MHWKPFTGIYDIHGIFYSEPKYALALDFIRRTKPETVFIGGDAIDAVSCSVFDHDRGFTNLLAEFEQLETQILDPLRAAAPKAKIIYLEGNHEFRLKRHEMKAGPELAGFFSLTRNVPLKKLGIKYIHSKSGNALYKFTDQLTMMHGKRYGENAAKLTLEKDWGSSFIMGHTHREQTYRKSLGNGRDVVGICSSCLAAEADYKDISNETFGFVEGEVNEKNGQFVADHVRITEQEMFSKGNNAHAVYTKGPAGKVVWKIKAGRKSLS